MTPAFLSTFPDARRAPRWLRLCRTVLRHKRLVFLMFVFGSAAGLVISYVMPEVYYAHSLIQLIPYYTGEPEFGPSGFDPVYVENICRDIDAAATQAGLPHPKLKVHWPQGDGNNE